MPTAVITTMVSSGRASGCGRPNVNPQSRRAAPSIRIAARVSRSLRRMVGEDSERAIPRVAPRYHSKRTEVLFGGGSRGHVDARSVLHAAHVVIRDGHGVAGFDEVGEHGCL